MIEQTRVKEDDEAAEMLDELEDEALDRSDEAKVCIPPSRA